MVNVVIHGLIVDIRSFLAQRVSINMKQMTNKELWEHIKTHYPDLAKFIQELKKAGLEPGRPKIYENTAFNLEEKVV